MSGGAFLFESSITRSSSHFSCFPKTRWAISASVICSTAFAGFLVGVGFLGV